jgi:hypothetical protein
MNLAAQKVDLAGTRKGVFMSITKIIVLLALVSLINGCVIAVNTDDWEDESWSSRQKRNSEDIEHLQLGTTEPSVRETFGDPDFTESFVRDGASFVILFYRTHRLDHDGETTKDETTPLVFVDSTLVGWGDSAIDNATAIQKEE